MIDCCVANLVALSDDRSSSSSIPVTVDPLVPTFKFSSTTVPVPFAFISKLALELFEVMMLSVIVTPSTCNEAICKLPGSIVIPPDLSPASALVVPNTNVSADSSHIIAALSPVDPLSIIIPASLSD